MPRTVLVTGTGFIGSHAARAFLQAGWTTYGLGRTPSMLWPASAPHLAGDLTDSSLIERSLCALAPDVVVHTAAPASVPDSFSDPVASFSGQVSPLHALLHAIRRTRQGCSVLLVSSAAVYGQTPVLPIREDSPSSPISPYGFHKLHQELLVDEHVRLFNLRAVKVRVFSTFGPGLRRLSVYEILQRARRGDRRVLGSASDSRDYLFVRELARGLEVISSRASFMGEVLNLGSGKELLLADLARAIFRAVGLSGDPEFDEVTLRGAPHRWQADVSSLVPLGFVPRLDLDTELRETLRWAQRDE